MNFQSVSYKYILQWEEDTISHSQADFQEHSTRDGWRLRNAAARGTPKQLHSTNLFYHYRKVHLCICRIIPIFTKKSTNTAMLPQPKPIQPAFYVKCKKYMK